MRFDLRRLLEHRSAADRQFANTAPGKITPMSGRSASFHAFRFRKLPYAGEFLSERFNLALYGVRTIGITICEQCIQAL